jgi:hypothetical protein
MFKSLIEKQLFLKNNLNKSLNLVKVSQIFCKKLSTNSTLNVKQFESMIETEKKSAKKYLLLEDKCNILSKLNVENVSKLLDIKATDLWKWSFGSHNCALIQFNKEIDVKNISNRLGLNSNSFPINTRMISIDSVPKNWFSENNCNQSNDNSIKTLSSKRDETLKVIESKNLYKTNEEFLNFLLNDKQLTELEIKLRFFVIIQLEELLCNGPFNKFVILPFGSSLAGNYTLLLFVCLIFYVIKIFSQSLIILIAGLGNSSSDLDLVLITQSLASEKSLNYSCRELLLERSENQKSLEVIADIVNNFVPNFSLVSRILRARVPIIKFNFDLAPIDVDLSIEVSQNNSHHGFVMASYLSLCHHLHPCVRDLLLFIRIWAKQHGINY